MKGQRRPWLTELVAFENPPAGGGSGGGSGGGTGTATPPPAPRTLADVLKEHPHLATELDTRTQEVATREKRQGKDSALQEFAKGLGVEDPNVIAEGYRRYAEQQAAALTEAQRKEQEADKKLAAAAEAEKKAKQAAYEAIAIKWLQDANASDAQVAALSLAAEGVTVDSTEDEIKAAVAKLKQRVPGLFAGAPSGTPGAGNAGAPPAGGPGKGDPGKGDVGALAKSQLQRMHIRSRSEQRRQ